MSAGSVQAGSRRHLFFLVGLLLLALAFGGYSLRQAGRQLIVLRACNAVEDEAWQEVLRLTEPHVGASETGRAAAECRCFALLATDAADQCSELMDEVLADPATVRWAPSAPLSIHLIQTRRDEGRAADAANLAGRAGLMYPTDPDIFFLELVTRSAVENEERVIRALTRRLVSEGVAAVRMRVSLATRHLQRGAFDQALRVLGSEPPPGAGDALSLWYEHRGMAQASAGDLSALQQTYEHWLERGGDPSELQARFALTLSLTGLQSPPIPTVERLRSALADDPGDQRTDDGLTEQITIRLILTLANDGRHDESLAVYDHGRERFELVGLSRDELLRSAAHRELAALPIEQRRAMLRIEMTRPVPGATLWLSPDPGAPLDSAYEPYPLVENEALLLERVVGLAPQRWVLRDALGRTVASGTQTLRPDTTHRLRIEPGAALDPKLVVATRRPADGRRRVALLVLDCADWRITQYLRTRGDLPVISGLIERGHSAVLLSDPPFTAAALESLVWPLRRSNVSFIGLVHRYGVELAGLASVGDNPLAALSWLLPEEADFFQVIGAGPLSAANLLFSHGGIDAGRHNEITGPNGQRRRLTLGTSSRDLLLSERKRFPDLAAVPRERDRVHIRTIAAEFDAVEELIQKGDVDLIAMRIEPLDILTHAHFAQAVASGQDDGRALLFEIYRYLDARLGSIDSLLDQDDVLVVMSDHGIRTSMEHSPYALFIASGGDIEPGRSSGTPDLRGIPRALADLFGIETVWPDTGVAPWSSVRMAPHELARDDATPHPDPASN